MMDMNEIMERCMDMIGGPMIGAYGLLILGILFVVLLLGLAALGAIGVWGYRKLKARS